MESDGIRRKLHAAEVRSTALKAHDRQAIVAADADELEETQWRFPINQVTDLMARLFPNSKETIS